MSFLAQGSRGDPQSVWAFSLALQPRADCLILLEIQATIIKYRVTEATEIYFLTVLEAGSPRAGSMARALFLACTWPPCLLFNVLMCLMADRGKDLKSSLSLEGHGPVGLGPRAYDSI